MSTFKSTNRKKNFSNPFGSLADPSAHIRTNKQTNKQTDKIMILISSHYAYTDFITSALKNVINGNSVPF